MSTSIETKENPALISSERVSGTDVYGAGDEKIGKIESVMIDKRSGRVAYAVMSFGGFLGIGEDHYAVPWQALEYDESLDGYRTQITKEQVEGAPAHSDDHWNDREWETRIHDHYGARYYWP